MPEAASSAGIRRCAHAPGLRRNARRRIPAARGGRHLCRNRGARRRHSLHSAPHARRRSGTAGIRRALRRVVPARRDHHHRSEIGLRFVARSRDENSARHSPARGATAGCDTCRHFSARTKIPDEFRGRTDEYVAMVIQEMLPRVAAEKLAEYCDVFCEPNVFPARAGARRFARRTRNGLRPAPARRSIHAPMPARISPRNWARQRPIIWRPPRLLD